MSKRKQRRNKHKLKVVNPEVHGLELGQIPNVMIAPDAAVDFNRSMYNADIVGCAYGSDRVDGYPHPIACLTILATNPAEIRTAFELFEHWGSQVDGESVDLEMLLCRDGTYLFGVGPDARRMINRMIRDQALATPIFPGATYIKTIDSTNPMLREWKDRLSSGIFPVRVMAATTELRDGVPAMDTIKPVQGAKSFVTFNLKIVTEEEHPNHFFLWVTERRAGTPPRTGQRQTSSAHVALKRQQVIDRVFPVTRGRIRRTKLASKIRSKLSALEISTSQIEQAAINCALSREFGSGHDHYLNVPDIQETWWQRLHDRVETAGVGGDVNTISEETIVRQIELDVAHTLRSHGATIHPKFSTNQRLFTRLGYGAH